MEVHDASAQYVGLADDRVGHEGLAGALQPLEQRLVELVVDLKARQDLTLSAIHLAKKFRANELMAPRTILENAGSWSLLPKMFRALPQSYFFSSSDARILKKAEEFALSPSDGDKRFW